MNKQVKVSVVMPLYNSERYVTEAIESVIAQTFTNWELIVVDDGSTDRSCEIVLEFVDKDARIKLLHNPSPNRMPSSPRNIGIQAAEGKYIAFIDSDDMVSEDYIPTILHKTLKEWDYCYISWKGKSNTIIMNNEPPSWNASVWNCIYKRDIIGNERFNPKLKIAEDKDFNNRVRKGKRANITKIIYYYNEDTPNSLTKQGELYNEKFR